MGTRWASSRVAAFDPSYGGFSYTPSAIRQPISRRECPADSIPLPIELVHLAIRDLRRLDQAARELLAHRVNINAAGAVGVLGSVSTTWMLKMNPVSPSAVNQWTLSLWSEIVENSPGWKLAVDRRADDVMVVVVFDAIVVPASEFPLDDQETGGHVVVAVGDDGAPLAHGEDLPAERHLARQPGDMGEADRQALGPFSGKLASAVIRSKSIDFKREARSTRW